MAKILLVEDNPETAAYVEKILAREMHCVEVVDNGEEAHSRLKHYEYDLVVLDWNIPGHTGPEICKSYRDARGITPILMLTANSTEDQKAFGLDSGADDYVTKPFSLKELAARVRALLRRNCELPADTLRAGDIELNAISHVVLKRGLAIKLAPKEYSLLEYFMRHPNQVFTSEQLLDRIWNAAEDASTEAFRSTLSRLRQKVDTTGGPSLIETIHGFGFRLNR